MSKINTPDTNPPRGPNSQIDLYDEAIRSTVDDEFIGRENFGLGYYREREMWQQVESFRYGLYAMTAFTRRIRERAIQETKRKLAEHGWQFVDPKTKKPVEIEGWEQLDEEERAEKDRRRYLEERGEEMWQILIRKRDPETGRRPAREALSELANLDKDWRPPHLRMAMMRHESSRSRGARLLDNLFERKKERVTNVDPDAANGGKR